MRSKTKTILSFVVMVMMLFLLSACEKSYNLTFETNGGNTIETISKKEKTELVFPTPTREGYFFVGWFEDEALTIPCDDAVMPSNDVTYYAKWTNEDPAIVSAAETAVAKAESSKDFGDIEAAEAVVGTLPDGSTKDGFLARLDAVREEAEMQLVIDGVELAESTKLMADITAAYELVNVLPDSDAKTSLLARVRAAELELKLPDAVAAVEKAESSLLQEDVNDAVTIVNDLPASLEKIGLQDRLMAVQQQITLVLVTQLVEDAEASRLQEDVNLAESYMLLLEEGNDKTALRERLDAVQQYIDDLADATAAVVKAEESKLQADVDAAVALANALPEGETKVNLKNRLDAVQTEVDITVAAAAVVKAEESKLQADVDAAVALVNALSDGEVKAGLRNRLDLLQATIDLALLQSQALQAVELAEATKLQSDVNLAQALVDSLPEGEFKSGLQGRLDQVMNFINLLSEAEASVRSAEATSLAVDVSSARSYVSQLPDGDVKNELSARLDAIVLTEIEINTDFPIEFETGTPQSFFIEVFGNSYVGMNTVFLLYVPEGFLFEFYIPFEDRWLPTNPYLEFPVNDFRNDFRGTFPTSGTYDVSIQIWAFGGNMLKKVDINDVLVVDSSEAREAVELAETYQLHLSVEYAQLLVEALPECNIRTGLQERLDAIVLTDMEISSIIPAEFEVGKPQQLTVSTVANSYEGESVRAHFTLPEGLLLEYQEGGEGPWLPLTDVFGPANGFLLGDRSSIFQATFSAGGFYTVTVSFKDMEGNVLGTAELTTTVVDTREAERLVILAEETKYTTDIRNAWNVVDTLPDGLARTNLSTRLDTIIVTRMEIITDASAFQMNVPQEFYVGTIANSHYHEIVRAYFTLPEGFTLEYQEVEDGDWQPLSNVFGPAEGFMLDNINTPLRGTFSAAGTYTVTVEFKTMDGIIIGSKDITATSYDIDAITDAVSLAEITRMSIDYYAAYDLVNALPAWDVMLSLANRLYAITLNPAELIVSMPNEFEMNEALTFSLAIISGSYRGEMVNIYFDFSESATLSYLSESSWIPFDSPYGPAGGFALSDGTFDFQCTFSTSGMYPLAFVMVDRHGNVCGRTDVIVNVLDTASIRSAIEFAENTKQYMDVRFALSLVDAMPDCQIKSELTFRIHAIPLTPISISVIFLGVYPPGVQGVFGLTMTSNSYFSENIYLCFTVPEGCTIADYATGIPLTDNTWPAGGFYLYDNTFGFNITFNVPGDSTIKVEARLVQDDSIVGEGYFAFPMF